jgi:hypothetical protein
VREALKRDLEAARFVADRAFRQYDAADPANRLVAGELEARWNKALARVTEVEGKIAAHDAATLAPVIDPGSLATLAADLKTVWAVPSTDARVKKRIVRTVIHEVIADIDPEAAEIVLVVHWIGGVHSEMRLPRRRRGQRNSTSADVIAAVRQLALIANDDLIAGILNRNGLLQATATAGRVSASPRCARITAFRSTSPPMTASNRGSTSATPRDFSASRPERSDWQGKPVRSKRFIPCRTVPGSSAALLSPHHRRVPSPSARGRTQNTPRDRIPISKASSLQSHRQMGVVMRDCSTCANPPIFSGRLQGS